MDEVIDQQEIARADTIAFHLYTKLFYLVNQARATEVSIPAAKADKWFNLESPDSELFPKEAREELKSISSLIPSPGVESFEVQVLLSVPELANNQVLVYTPPDSSRVRLEPTPRFVLLESWRLDFDSTDTSHAGIAAATTYKHGIILFRSLFSLLRLLPTWKLYQRLRRKTGGVIRNGNLGIQLRVRSFSEERNIFGFGDAASPSHTGPLPTGSHSFTAIPHLAGSFSLTTTYLSHPNFQLDDLESVLSSRFLSLDHQDFVPTLDKNRQRDSITGSSLPVSSGMRTVTARSPPRPIGRVMSGADKDSIVERFILPTKVSTILAPSLGTSASTGASALIPPPRPIPPPSSSSATSPYTTLAQTPPVSALPISRIRKESFNSTSSSQMSTRDLPPQMSSVSSSPATGGVPIVRRPTINTVHPFKSNTLASHSPSSPSLSIRQGMFAGSPLSAGLPSSLSGQSHVRHPSQPTPSPTTTRFTPSPILGSSPARPSPPIPFSPSTSVDKRPETSGSVTSNGGRQSSIAFGTGEPEEHFVTMPPRKRYSSSFSHRYVGSVGSGTNVPVVGSAGVSPAESSGRDIPASVGGRFNAGSDGRKDHHRTGSYATDDDDISIFVQDIDSRKPLSGRSREHEEREREFNFLGPRNETRRPLGEGHDRETTDTTIKARRRDMDFATSHHRHVSDPPRSSPLSFTRPGIGQATFDRDPAYGTSPPPPSGISAAAAAAAATSVSPNRGAMLTSRDEVDERLKLMHEKFMSSLKVLDQAGLGKTRNRRDKDMPQLFTGEVDGKSQSSLSPSSSPPSSVPPSGGSSGSAYPSPYVTTGRSLPPTSEDSGSSGEMAPADAKNAALVRAGLGIAIGERGYGYHPYDNLASRGLSLGRGGNLSTSSTLNHSDENSQGSEEVLGRMDLYYEERRNRLSQT